MSTAAPVSSQDQASATVTARLAMTTARSRRVNHSAGVLIDDAGMAQMEARELAVGVREVELDLA